MHVRRYSVEAEPSDPASAQPVVDLREVLDHLAVRPGPMWVICSPTRRPRLEAGSPLET